MLGKTSAEIGAMPLSQAEKYNWFLSQYPMGEEAMDIRFQTLRMDLASALDQIVYAIYRAAGSRKSPPKRRSFKNFRIFKRLGDTSNDDFTKMDSTAINKRMMMVAAQLGAEFKR